jgi:hypothetical protein
MPKAGFSGDMRGLLNLNARLRELASVPSQAAKEASTEIASLIQEEFDAGNDAYGKAWAPLRPATLKKGRHPPPLTDTHEMRESVEVKPMKGAGIQITLNETPAIFHQKGTRKMAKRPILPDGKDMPPKWEEAIHEATDAAVQRRMAK